MIGTIDRDVTTYSVLIKTRAVKWCTVSLAAINIAGVGDHSPPVEVPIDDLHDKRSEETNYAESAHELIVSIRLTGTNPH